VAHRVPGPLFGGIWVVNPDFNVRLLWPVRVGRSGRHPAGLAGTQALGDRARRQSQPRSSLSSLSCMPEQAGIKHRGRRRARAIDDRLLQIGLHFRDVPSAGASDGLQAPWATLPRRLARFGPDPHERGSEAQNLQHFAAEGHQAFNPDAPPSGGTGCGDLGPSPLHNLESR
jgi:hypothetical protein